ncbi:hypothetical protein JCM10450v2_000621 [Rhodotorula kratochvilovae]
MHNAPAGFSAGLVLPAGGTTPAHAPHLAQREYLPSAPSAVERTAYIEGGPSGAGLRVFFAREERLKPVRGLEAYASYLFCPDSTPWVKVYAVGEGVAPGAGHWCIDGNFGPEAPDLDATLHATVSLKIYPCTLFPGTELGNGLLYVKDVAEMDREHPVCVFTWHYASRLHLEQLGVLGSDGPSQLAPSPLPSPYESSLAFLRFVSDLAISLLAPAQRAQLADQLAASHEVRALLPSDASAELEAYCAANARAAAGMGARTYEVKDDEVRVTRSRSAPGGPRARRTYVESEDDSE